MNVRTRNRAGGESSADVTSAGTAKNTEQKNAVDMSRAETLLRSVTGIADARICTHPAGGVSVVRIHCTDEASPGQIMRNVRSALIAGFGLAVSPECIEFVSASVLKATPIETPTVAEPITAAPTEAPKRNDERGDNNAPRSPRVPQTTPLVATHAPMFMPPTAPLTAASIKRGIQIAQPHADSNAPAASFGAQTSTIAATLGQSSRMPRILNIMPENDVEEITAATSAPEQAVAVSAVGSTVRDLVASAAALRLETVEVRRQSGRLRCRVVISLGNDHFGAVADSADPNAGEIHLAGRVACDALRAGGFTEARFDGATVAQINGRQHVVVALSEWMGGETMVLSGAAPLEDVPERAAAIAAIKAVLAQDVN